MIERFADDERGGFFETSSDHEQLVARRKDLEDNPIPAGNSSAAYALLRLAALSGELRVRGARAGRDRAAARARLPAPAGRSPTCSRRSTSTSRPTKEVALVGPDTSRLERVVRAKFRPHIVLAGGEPDGVPLMEGRTPVNGAAAAYVCEHFACRAPVTEPEELEALLA